MSVDNLTGSFVELISCGEVCGTLIDVCGPRDAISRLHHCGKGYTLLVIREEQRGKQEKTHYVRSRDELVDPRIFSQLIGKKMMVNLNHKTIYILT
ncbi:MAG TPA: hypothetical protein VMD74_03900 [Candidatus Methylomirabilis sp.]|nr:hypothetical protein [Candidatus Methylomirabilis sp.]